MQEFVYYNKEKLDFPLSEDIKIAEKKDTLNESDEDFLISNSKEVQAEFYAPEIDFYIKNSEDSLPKKMENTKKLYEINALRFDNAKDMLYKQDINSRVLLVADKKEKAEFLTFAKEDDFELFNISALSVKSITRSIGNLKVVFDDEGEDFTLEVAQIVWYNAKEIAFKQSGSFDPRQSSSEEVVKILKENIKKYTYKKFISYDPLICQYHERREETCAKCVEVCPTTAIIKIDKDKHLQFSQIDCHGCGGCISVCPSGALDYTPSPKEALYEMSKFYKNQIPLIIPQKMNIETLDCKIKQNVLPFAIEGEKFLHEATLLTLIQESGSQVIFYSDFLSKGTKDSIDILNSIFQKKYKKYAVLIAMNKEELKTAIQKVDFIKDSFYTLNQEGSRKREIFALRLRHLVGEEDLGLVKTGEHVHYGKIKINQDKCTLCLSCVGACNMDALSAHAEDNTLRFNASLCTSCGYCLLTCPEEDCISLQEDIIELKPSWFKDEVLAKDELFACLECGKEFATKKAIEKIAKMMLPLFKGDEIKQRTLYCCEDCKPKIMMQSYIPQEKQKQGAKS